MARHARPDIAAVEWVSLIGLTGWMIAVGLNGWLRPPYALPAYAVVAPEIVWQVAASAVAVAKAWSLVLAYRPERWAFTLRRAIMVLAVGWWCFIVGTLAAYDPLAPALGAYLGCAAASAWACYVATLRRGIGGGD